MIIKKRAGLALLIVVMFSFIAAGCSSFPKSNLVTKATAYDVLGFLDGPFRSYSEALAAARKVYPNADGVISIKKALNDRLLPKNRILGYFAVKFKIEEAPREKFLGIF